MPSSPLTPSDVAAVLAPMAAVFQVPIDEALCVAWKMALVDGLIADGITPVTGAELRAAALHHLHTSRYRMTPADAWDYIKAKRAETRDADRLVDTRAPFTQIER